MKKYDTTRIAALAILFREHRGCTHSLQMAYENGLLQMSNKRIARKRVENQAVSDFHQKLNQGLLGVEPQFFLDSEARNPHRFGWDAKEWAGFFIIQVELHEGAVLQVIAAQFREAEF